MTDSEQENPLSFFNVKHGSLKTLAANSSMVHCVASQQIRYHILASCPLLTAHALIAFVIRSKNRLKPRAKAILYGRVKLVSIDINNLCFFLPASRVEDSADKHSTGELYGESASNRRMVVIMMTTLNISHHATCLSW